MNTGCKVIQTNVKSCTLISVCKLTSKHLCIPFVTIIYLIIIMTVNCITEPILGDYNNIVGNISMRSDNMTICACTIMTSANYNIINN